MTKAPSSPQELRRRIYRKAKSETTHRLWGLFMHITKTETLEEAYRIAKGNGGAPGIDGRWCVRTLGEQPLHKRGVCRLPFAPDRRRDPGVHAVGLRSAEGVAAV